MQHFEFNRALDEVWKTVRALNQYLEQVKPWEIAKHRETDTEAEPHLAEVLAYAAGTLVQVADLLVPFMPQTAATIRNMFETGVVPDTITPLFPKVYLHTADPRAKKE
jgi:methionyl-tRNA synthetase